MSLQTRKQAVAIIWIGELELRRHSRYVTTWATIHAGRNPAIISETFIHKADQYLTDFAIKFPYPITLYRSRRISFQASTQNRPLKSRGSVDHQVHQRTRPAFQPQHETLRDDICKVRCRMRVIHGVVRVHDFGAEVFHRLSGVLSMRDEIYSCFWAAEFRHGEAGGRVSMIFERRDQRSSYAA